MNDLARLFFGALVQWAAQTAFTVWVVSRSRVGVFVAVFSIQTIWWLNIQHTIKSNSPSRWLAWSLGAATGATLGLLIR